jgi:hypothetical protein
MADWKALYSPTGEAYDALEQTLLNLPSAVPPHSVANLNRLHLEGPLTGRLAMITMTRYAEQCELRGRQGACLRPLFEADEAQFEEALTRLSAYQGRRLDPRRFEDVQALADLLAEYPGPGRGKLVRLAEEAIRWHRAALDEERLGVFEWFDGQVKTAEPAVAPPRVEGIRFLDRVSALVSELIRMRLSVEPYAQRVMYGESHYYFHVKRRGEEAVVEVNLERDPIGADVLGGRRNRAGNWGRQVLNQWASRGLVAGLQFVQEP